MKRFAACFLLLCVFLASCASVDLPETVLAKGQELTIVAATDLHYLPSDLVSSVPVLEEALFDGDGKMIQYSDALLDAFHAEIVSAKPDVLILTGDLTNNGEKVGHAALAERLSAIEADSGTKVYVIPGNHDLLNPQAAGFAEDGAYRVVSVNAEDFAEIYGGLGYDEAISRDPASLSYLAAPAEDLWLLMLDTNIYDFNELLGHLFANGEVKESTLTWIQECLALAKKNKAKVISATHHSLIPNQQSSRTQGYTLDNADEVLALLSDTVRLNLSGHIHVQDIRSSGGAGAGGVGTGGSAGESEGGSGSGGDGGSSSGSKGGSLYDISNGAFSVYPVQYGKVTVDPAYGYHYESVILSVDSWARAVGEEDPVLLDFSALSKAYFARNQAAKAQESLAELQDSLGYSDAEIVAMADFLGLTNASYFGGALDKVLADELMAMPAYALWQKTPSDFRWRVFLDRVFSATEVSKVEVSIPWVR